MEETAHIPTGSDSSQAFLFPPAKPGKRRGRRKNESAKPWILASRFSQKKGWKPVWLQWKPPFELWVSSVLERFFQDQLWRGSGWSSSHTSSGTSAWARAVACYSHTSQHGDIQGSCMWCSIALLDPLGHRSWFAWSSRLREFWVAQRAFSCQNQTCEERFRDDQLLGMERSTNMRCCFL